LKAIATFVSIIFHPLLASTYLFSLFAWLYPPMLFPFPERSFKGVILLVFITTFILPAINIYFFKAFGTIQSVQMPSRRERVVPFFMISILYSIITYMLYSKFEIGWNDAFMKWLLIIDSLVLVSFVSTFFSKISIHSLSVGAVVSIIVSINSIEDTGIFLYPLIASILLAGVVMSSRMYVKAHTFREVVSGAVVGFITAALGFAFVF
jgi:membrane-associated phospholipid phosphatase